MPKYEIDLIVNKGVPNEEEIRQVMKRNHYTEKSINGMVTALEKANTIIAFGKEKAGNDNYYERLDDSQKELLFYTQNLINNGLNDIILKADVPEYERKTESLNEKLDDALKSGELGTFAKTYIKPVNEVKKGFKILSFLHAPNTLNAHDRI